MTEEMNKDTALAVPEDWAARVRSGEEPEFIPIRLKSFQEAMQFAKILVETKFLPEAIATPGQAVAIMLQGQELGLPPMLALQEIYSVHGKLSTSAKVMLSMFKKAGGKTKVLKDTKECTEILFTHPDGDEYTSKFTWDMATATGLTGGHNWKKWPEDMVWARCVSRGLRRLAPDIIGNLYTGDEVSGGEVIDVAPVVRPDPPGEIDLARPMAVKTEPEGDDQGTGEPNAEQEAEPQDVEGEVIARHRESSPSSAEPPSDDALLGS